MAYVFNGGRGGVICDTCRILMDADLCFKDYNDSYGKLGQDGDVCWRCMAGKKKREKEGQK
jgi:hypothetical protein